MIKVKDGYAKLINTSYTGDISLVLLSNGGTIGYDVSTNTILATIGSNVASADKLKNEVKLWGLYFDGTRDVRGSIHLGEGADYEIGTGYSSRNPMRYNKIVFGCSTTGIEYHGGNWTGGSAIAHTFIVGSPATKAMIINNSGNITIGSSDLAETNYKLYVDGNIRTTGIATANKFVSGDGINDFSAGTVKLDVLNIPTSAGGTTFGPGSNGQVLKSNGTTVYWGDGGSSGGGYWANLPTQSATDATTIPTFGGVIVNGTSILNGLVGIGILDPKAKLTVNVSALSANPTSGLLGTLNTMSVGAAGSYGTYFWTRGTGKGYIQVGREDGTATTYDLILQLLGGNVGIGTENPAQKLDVAGKVKADALYLTRTNGDVAFTIANEASTNGFNISATGGSSFIRFYTNNGGSSSEERMRIHTNGFVGIGIPSPSYKLDVAGAIQSSDTVYGRAITSVGDSTIPYLPNVNWFDLTRNVGFHVSYRLNETAKPLRFYYKNSDTFTLLVDITSTGNVMINSSSRPGLSIKSSFTTSDNINLQSIFFLDKNGVDVGHVDVGGPANTNSVNGICGISMFNYRAYNNNNSAITAIGISNNNIPFVSCGGLGTPYYELLHTGNFTSRTAESKYWTAQFNLNTWSRILSITNYTSVLVTIGLGGNNEATVHTYLISTGWNCARIVLIGNNGFSSYANIQVRITRTSSTLYYLEVYHTYNYNGNPDDAICRFTKLSEWGTITPITTITAGGGTVCSSLTSSATVAMNFYGERSVTADSAATLSGGSVAMWGTLTSANGYTNVCTWDTGATTGAFSLAGKGGQMSLQLDGFFYQNEGKYLVLDTSNYTSYTDGRYVNVTGDTMTNTLTIGAKVSSRKATWLKLVTPGHTGSPAWCVGVDDTTDNSYLYMKYNENDSTYFYVRHDGCSFANHFYENSDINLKTNIETINTSDNIPQLKSFNWKEDGKHSYGLIAQELEEMGYTELVEESNGKKTVQYSAALSLIVGKLQVKIKELEKEIEILKNKN